MAHNASSNPESEMKEIYSQLGKLGVNIERIKKLNLTLEQLGDMLRIFKRLRDKKLTGFITSIGLIDEK